MQCTAQNGYAGWNVVDKETGVKVENVAWVDPDAKTYSVYELPFRVDLAKGEVAKQVIACSEITTELSSTTFWIVKAPIAVAPLSLGRQADREPTDTPCADCCQPQACRRTGWCAAHRAGFGSVAP